MHFNPGKTPKNAPDPFDEPLLINGIEIDEVKETKFLGVTIDNQLSWIPHIKNLTKKLKYNSGMLNRIKDFVPQSHHKSLYYTLFESHLTYGITVWGGVADSILNPIFVAQKRCIRIMFGDKAAYLDKFKTCVRARTGDFLKLGSEFYMKEHTKPLFNTHEILVTQHLYHYHTILNTFKILKTHTPISLYSCYKFSQSQRRALQLITSFNSHNFMYKSGTLWNIFITSENLNEVNDFSVSFNWVKTKLKKWLFRLQKLGDQCEWADENFILW